MLQLPSYALSFWCILSPPTSFLSSDDTHTNIGHRTFFRIIAVDSFSVNIQKGAINY